MMRRLAIALLMLGLMVWQAVPVAAEPGFRIKSPADGAVIESTEVTVELEFTDFTILKPTIPFAESGQHPEANRTGEGHLHMMLDLQPVVILTDGAPYTFTDVPPGEHQLTIEATNNDHSSFSPPMTQVVRFRTMPSQVAPATGAAAPSWALVMAIASGALVVVGAGMALRRCGHA